MSTTSSPSPARLPLLLLLATLALSVVLNGYLLVAAGEDKSIAEVRDLTPAGLHAELARTRAALEACRADTTLPDSRSGGSAAADNPYVTSSK